MKKQRKKQTEKEESKEINKERNKKTGNKKRKGTMNNEDINKLQINKVNKQRKK
jgi:hypothetical protein